MQASAKVGPDAIEMAAAEGALELWSSIAAGLRQAGYSAAGPEYLRLSRILIQQHSSEVLAGGGSSARWDEIRQAAAEAVALLRPVVEAADLLAGMPSDLVLAPALASEVEAPSAPMPEVGALPADKGATRAKAKAPRARSKSKARKAPRKAAKAPAKKKKPARGGASTKGAAGSAKRKRTAKR